MTQAPTESQDIRRHPDGSIDIDFYRKRAAALRGQAKRDRVMLKMASAIVLTVAGGLALAVLVAAPVQHAPAERRVAQLTDAEVMQIRETIDRDYMVEGDLRREVAINIKRLMDLGAYRGLRHRKQLPVRGQRTHTNARTRKGKAKPIAGKKK